MTDFKQKYLKYKSKYYNLKKIIGGAPKKVSELNYDCIGDYIPSKEEVNNINNRQKICLYAHREKSITTNNEDDPVDINEIFRYRQMPWISGIIDINKSYDRFINKKLNENPTGDILDYLNNQINEKKDVIKRMYDSTLTLDNVSLDRELQVHNERDRDIEKNLGGLLTSRIKTAGDLKMKNIDLSQHNFSLNRHGLRLQTFQLS